MPEYGGNLPAAPLQITVEKMPKWFAGAGHTTGLYDSLIWLAVTAVCDARQHGVYAVGLTSSDEPPSFLQKTQTQ